MVSPRRTVDVENRRAQIEGLAPNLLSVKNQNLLKPPSLPLGDVRNTLAAARQLFTNTNEAKEKQGKGSELKPLKPVVADPLLTTQTKELYEPDPVWDAPLAWEANVEDTYHDILPYYLQLNDQDWDRLAWNWPGPRTGRPLSSEDDDDVFNISIKSSDEYLLQDALEYMNRLEDTEELLAVPPCDSDDEYDENSLIY